MPGPPPPPPPAVPPPPMLNISTPAFNPPKGADDRAALLKSIQKGTKLKKTVTNDKSAPVIGKVANNNSNTTVTNGANNYGSSTTPTPMGLGGLFAGGMPKLKPMKNRTTNVSTNNHPEQNGYTKPSIREKSPVQTTPSFNFNNIQNEVKKKLANDSRDRGPPPPKPTPESVTAEFNNIAIQQSNSSNNFLHPQSNNSSLHRKTQSNVNLSAIENNLSIVSSSLSVSSKSINHGKPNLAPKPPTLNGKPRTPPKKLVTNGKAVSRAHSLKSPRSPTTVDVPIDAAIKYGTVRNMSSVLSNSLGNNLNSRSKMTLNGRPSAPPPSIPVSYQNSSTPAPPSKMTLMKPPNHAPPPPPSVIPHPPNHAPPPPPPSKTLSKSTGSSFSPSQAPPPPPPPRNSSMRDQNRKQSTIEFDERFKDFFRSSTSFPRPPPFRNVLKIYANRQGLDC